MLSVVNKLLLHFYRYLVSPLVHLLAGVGYGCRFEPSCSRYAEQALEEHGIWRGGLLALKRVCRCHPWGGSGFDPVPHRVGTVGKRLQVGPH